MPRSSRLTAYPAPKSTDRHAPSNPARAGSFEGSEAAAAAGNLGRANFWVRLSATCSAMCRKTRRGSPPPSLPEPTLYQRGCHRAVALFKKTTDAMPVVRPNPPLRVNGCLSAGFYILCLSGLRRSGQTSQNCPIGESGKISLECSLSSQAGSAGWVSLSCGFAVGRALQNISPAVSLLSPFEHKI
jgi:hypothetical protein